MDFDEIVVKDSPGLCRCCLSEGCYKDLSTEYTWMGENEIYADMLFECFDISITQHTEGPNGSSRLICEVCITRLRDACNFKKQVLESEKKFVDMVGRGDFKPKAVIILEATPLKTEFPDPLPGPSEDDCEIEYLDEDDYTDGYRDDEPLQKLQAAGITVSSLSVKGKRGKKRSADTTKPVKAEKKKKTEGKSSKSKSSKGKITLSNTSDNSPTMSSTKRNRLMKKNAILIIESTSVWPFKWHRQNYLCFFCHKTFKDPELLKKHTLSEHEGSVLRSAVDYLRRDEKVKIDVSSIICRLCNDIILNIDALKDHLETVHKKKFFDTNVGVIPYKLDKDAFRCAICDASFEYFIKLNQHMNEHYGNYICEACGKSFLSQDRLRCHSLSHGTNFKCQTCTMTFDSVTQKINHEIREHKKEKILKCFYCVSTFTTYSQRKIHHRTEHNIDIPEFKCPVCGKVFQIMSKMKSHVQEVHVKEKNFACPMCDQKFFSRTHVQKHMIKHYGERVHECGVCKKSYARKQTLRDHMRIHSGDNLVCPVCSKTFAQNNSLKLHLRVHHPNVTI